jgi:hypothetical protein
MSELTTGYELLLYGALVIVTIFTLDWWESRFGAGDERKGKDLQASTRRQRRP